MSFNVDYKPSEPKLLRALALYRKPLRFLYGEKKTGLARSFAKFADLTLRSVRSEDEDDVMFASDTLFRLRVFGVAAHLGEQRKGGRLLGDGPCDAEGGKNV